MSRTSTTCPVCYGPAICRENGDLYCGDTEIVIDAEAVAAWNRRAQEINREESRPQSAIMRLAQEISRAMARKIRAGSGRGR